MRVLVVTAIPAEARAVSSALHRPLAIAVGPYPGTTGVAGAGEVTVVAGGVGAAAAASATATGLALDRPDRVLTLGIAGAFTPGPEVLVASKVIAADLGAETPDGFVPLADLGFTGDRFDVALAGPLADRLRAAGLAVAIGPVLTVATVTGTPARVRALTVRHEPVGEAMEGHGVATAAVAHGVPFGEVRTVSNVVGNRDHETWDLSGALGTLPRVTAALLAEPLP